MVPEMKSIDNKVVKYSTLVSEKVLKSVVLWLIKDIVEPALKISHRAQKAAIDGHTGTGRRVMLEILS